MKPIIKIIVFVMCTLMSHAWAQNSGAADNALVSFENQVARIENFMATPQTALVSYKSSEALLFYLVKFYGKDFKYDVRKTDSLVSPYTGVIRITMVTNTNGQCGTIQIGSTGVGWPTEREATDKIERVQCFDNKRARPPFQATFQCISKEKMDTQFSDIPLFGRTFK